MKFKDAIGIDVSKNTIDVFIHGPKLTQQFENDLKGFKKMYKWATSHYSGDDFDHVIFCFEYTGIYSTPLSIFLDDLKQAFILVAPLQIKKSMGMVRGKNDKVDAYRIAEYAYLRRDLIKPTKIPSKNIMKLQKLISLREKLVKQRAGFSADLKEYRTVLGKERHGPIINVQNKMLNYLAKQIKAIEQELKELIKNDEHINKIYKLVTSVDGIGLILAVNLIVTTNCFMNFDCARKYACYAGIAPFEKQSGTSLRSKSKVSHTANKNMKSLLTLAAFSAIQKNSELKNYYRNRLEKGKSKMGTINIIRNKIVHRVFAVVKRQTPYVNVHAFAN
ncbi:IS110 family transposase [Allomuricauda sp. ARW1Y1]|jgi:transposase|uniref:IS110 family transposase n=1 Tax=Allomuricauda sp. ARW1Y1 TaxID=2663843 RepID=UPI0015CB40CA|nr:IS110 family transposase [Muricauda sp. ARW1Y1]NYJ28075.1 transposase [Muricauda sp. ARW1Y1]